MAKQYRVDTGEGMAEYIKSVNEEQLAKDTYYTNWQNWVARQDAAEKKYAGLGKLPGQKASSYARPQTPTKYKSAESMYQDRSDFYKKLTTSATESVNTINKYWDATNLALKQKAGYDISQAYKNYLEQETALKESGLAAGSKAYVGGELSEAYKETKTGVDTSLAANLESSETKRTEQIETIKTTVDKAIEEYDALFEGSKYDVENNKKLTNLANDINLGLSTFADSADIKKNIDSLQVEYDKLDAIATRLEATGNTEAAKTARAKANAVKKIIDTANTKLQTYAYDKQQMTQKMLDKYFKSDEFNEFAEEVLRNEGLDLDSMTSDEKKNAINSIKSEFVTTVSEGEGAGARVLTDFGKTRLAEWFKDDTSLGLMSRMDELGLTDAAVTNLLGTDKDKTYFGSTDKSVRDYYIGKAKETFKNISDAKYIGTAQVSEKDSYTVDGKTYSKKGKDVSSNRLDISKEDYDKIPVGTVFEAKVNDNISYPEYLKEYDSELKSYGFKINGSYYSMKITPGQNVDKIKQELENKGFIVEVKNIAFDSVPAQYRYLSGEAMFIVGRKNNTKKFYKDTDGKLYKMF